METMQNFIIVVLVAFILGMVTHASLNNNHHVPPVVVYQDTGNSGAAGCLTAVLVLVALIVFVNFFLPK